MINQNSTLEEISQAIDLKEKELRASIKAKGILIQEINELGKDILRLEIKKKELSIPLSKARDNVNVIESTLRTLRGWYWGKKNI